MAKKQINSGTGAEAAAHAMRQINPDVVPVYPITPQTPIAQTFAQFLADGKVDSEMIRVESEHSAMSATVGASSAGARAMTATASAGLALMWEILGIASGLRCPIVMSVVNRALSAPINIHCDHSDSMGAREQGLIQIFSETAQEVYENILLAIKLSENEKVLLPTMVMQDGFITSHSVQNLELFPDKTIRDFVGSYKAKYPLLDVENPVTIGPLQLQDYYFETHRQIEEGMSHVPQTYLQVGKELKKITGREYPFFEAYKLDDAEAAIVVLSSTAANTKVAVDRLREKGLKVGLLKPRLYRPFIYQEAKKLLKNVERIAVLDRSMSPGVMPPLFSDIKLSLHGENNKLQSYIFGLGGRDIFIEDIEKVFQDLLKDKISNQIKYIGLRE